MINIWGTFCSPCLQEMPALAELNQEYKDKGFQVVGIVVDAGDANGTIIESQVALAKEIVEKTGADYLHMLPSADLLEAKLKDVSAIPETIFVDQNGKIVGESYLGGKSKSDWKEIIEQTLKEVN